MPYEFSGKTIVVTGAGRGIGRALATRLVALGAKVVVSDLHLEDAQQTAMAIGGHPVACDVTVEADVRNLVLAAEQEFGQIDLFCSNAGVCFGEPDTAASASNAHWQACWDIHVMAHVYAARAVLPDMIRRGDGYLLQIASAAGLLNQIGDAAYSASKHAAVGFAESLSITHADDGVTVSVVCPQYVATPMLGYAVEDTKVVPQGDVMSVEQLVDAVIKGVEQQRFLILPHPQVAQYFQSKASDYGRWIGGMVKLRRRIMAQLGHTRIADLHKWL